MSTLRDRLDALERRLAQPRQHNVPAVAPQFDWAKFHAMHADFYLRMVCPSPDLSPAEVRERAAQYARATNEHWRRPLGLEQLTDEQVEAFAAREAERFTGGVL